MTKLVCPDMTDMTCIRPYTGVNSILEACYQKLNPHINLPFNFLIQKYFFHDSPTWNMNYSEMLFQVLIKYSEYLLMLKSSRLKKVQKSRTNRIGIDKSEVELTK